MASERLPAALAWPMWALAALFTLAGYVAGSIASDLWGYVLTWKRERTKGE